MKTFRELANDATQMLEMYDDIIDRLSEACRSDRNYKDMLRESKEARADFIEQYPADMRLTLPGYRDA